MSTKVLSDIETHIKQATEIKNAALNYFTQKITPNNFGELQEALFEKDESKTGHLKHDDFIRCLSRSKMKCTEREVEKLVSELDTSNTGQVNYREFLKYSYMCSMYINHFKLQNLLQAKLGTE